VIASRDDRLEPSLRRIFGLGNVIRMLLRRAAYTA
jgi:hypothetical protein